MRAPSTGAIVGVLLLATLLVAVLLGTRHRPAEPARASAIAPASSVASNGFTLTSTSVEPVTDDATFPAGPHADLVNQRCLACHSASMVLTQPPLKREQWQAIVEKMRDTYHAPLAPGEVPLIVDYLSPSGASISSGER